MVKTFKIIQEIEFEEITKGFFVLVENGKVKTNMNWFEQNELLEKINENQGAKRKLRLMTLQETYDLAYEDGKFGDFLKKYWIWNAEFIEKDRITVNGKSVMAKIYEDDLLKTLEEARLFKKGKHDIKSFSIWLDDKKQSAVRCFWVSAVLGLYAVSYWPLVREVDGALGVCMDKNPRGVKNV